MDATFNKNLLFQLEDSVSNEYYSLLSNPMLLTVYCETNQLNQANLNSRLFSFPSKIETKHDLINAFF